MSLRNNILRVFGIAAAVAATSCVTESPGCESIGVYGISILVQDSVTGANGPFSSVYALAVADTFRDSLLTSQILVPTGNPPKLTHINLALEHPGTFDVTVSAQGYATWSKHGVVVPLKGCHVETQRLTALMAK